MQILRVLVLALLAASTSSTLSQSSLDNNTIPAKLGTFSFLPSANMFTLPQYVFHDAQSNLLHGKTLPRLTLNPEQDSEPHTYLRLLSPNLPPESAIAAEEFALLRNAELSLAP